MPAHASGGSFSALVAKLDAEERAPMLAESSDSGNYKRSANDVGQNSSFTYGEFQDNVNRCLRCFGFLLLLGILPLAVLLLILERAPLGYRTWLPQVRAWRPNVDRHPRGEPKVVDDVNAVDVRMEITGMDYDLLLQDRLLRTNVAEGVREALASLACRSTADFGLQNVVDDCVPWLHVVHVGFTYDAVKASIALPSDFPADSLASRVRSSLELKDDVALRVDDALVSTGVSMGFVRVSRITAEVVEANHSRGRRIYRLTASELLPALACVLVGFSLCVLCMQLTGGRQALQRQSDLSSSSVWRFGRVMDASKGSAMLDGSYDFELDSTTGPRAQPGLTLSDKERCAWRAPLPALSDEGIANSAFTGSGIGTSRGNVWALGPAAASSRLALPSLGPALGMDGLQGDDWSRRVGQRVLRAS